METVMMDFSDIATGSFDEDKPKINDQHETRNLIVYTTKLDDMKIFKDNTTDMGVNTIINSIIKESKPKLNHKRKCTQEINSHNSYEDLFCRLNTFNEKVTRIAKYNNRLLSMCKPVKVVLEDIKYTLLRTQTTESRTSKINKRKRLCDKQLTTNNQSRKHTCRILYDQQLKEADMYYLDKNFFIKEYKKYSIDKSNDNIFLSLKKDKNVSESSCCCWYNREQFLKTLSVFPHETLRFMRKPHKCAINLCRCCCREKTMYVSRDSSSIRPSLLKPSESHSIWLNKMTTKMRTSLPLSEILRTSLLSKSLSVVPELSKNIDPMNPVIGVTTEQGVTFPFVHSTNINFGREHYAIGADGQIKLYLRNTSEDRPELPNLVSKTANNIVGDICCWYKREEFAGRLLALGALSNTVNYIRSVHSCSPTNCSCCCKPLNNLKPKLTLLPKATRHTNDLVSKKVNIQVRVSGVVETSVSPVCTSPTTRKNTNIVSFNVSLSALEMISKGSEDVYHLLMKPESATLDKNTSVRVHLKKTRRHKILIECSHLNSFTTKELKMLDIIFRAVKKNTYEQSKPKPKNNTPRVKNYSGFIYHTTYPLILNAQLSVTTDLRSKRFLPSLKAHLKKYNLPQMQDISVWRSAEKDA